MFLTTMEVQICVYIMTFLSYAWGFCDLPGWKVNVNRQKCFSFHNDSQDFVTAQSVCAREGGHIADLNIDSANILTMFNDLDSSTYFWTIDNNDTLLDEISYKNETNHKEDRTMKNCSLLRMVDIQNITLHRKRCDFKSKFLCERHGKSLSADLSIINKGGRYVVIMETRDYVAIAVGTAILVLFCVVILVDILNHIKRQPQHYKQMVV